MKMIRYCMVVALAGAIVACSGGGGGSGGGASNGRKPTGYLKADLPQIPQSAAMMSLKDKNSVQPMAVDSDYGYYSTFGYLQTILENNNDSEHCSGSASNIPYILCMVEILGINKPGTYAGQNDAGEKLSVVVTDITGDASGHDLKVVITNTTRNKIVFKYKANADGTKGMIEAHQTLFFNGGEDGDKYFVGVSLVWDKTDVSKASLTYQSQFYEYSGAISGQVGPSVTLLKAQVDETTGIADVIAFDIQGRNDQLKPGKIVRGQFIHGITNGVKQIFTPSKCETDGHNELKESDCFTVSDTNYPMMNSNYKCGTMNGVSFDVTEQGALGGLSYGSYVKGAFVNSDCQSLNASFSVRLDKSSSDNSVVGDMVYAARSATWATFNLFDNASWLDAN